MASQGIGIKPTRRISLPRVSRFRQTLLYPELGMTFGIWSFRGASIPPDISDATREVVLGEQYRWDVLSYRVYSTPYLWWVLCLANRALDPFVTPKVGDLIRVPDYARITRLLLTDKAQPGTPATQLVSRSQQTV